MKKNLKKLFAAVLCVGMMTALTACGGADNGNDSDSITVSPLPVTIDMENLESCTLAVSLEEGNAYVDDNGAMQMKVEVFAYEQYDMVDISQLKEGDKIVRGGEEVAVESVERNDLGLVSINGGQENGGFDLYSNDETIFYEIGFDDVKSYYSLGEAEIPVSTEFEFTDASNWESDPVVYYPGDFLTEDAGIVYDFTPHNTTIVVEGGKVIAMNRIFTP